MIGLSVMIGGLLALGGCTAQEIAPPPVTVEQYANPDKSRQASQYPPRTVLLHNLQRVTDPHLDPNARVESLRLVTRLGGAEPDVRQQLQVVLADGQTPEKLRRACLELLMRHEAASPDLAAHVAASLPRLETEGELKNQVLAWLAKHPAPAVLGEVVSLWAAERSVTSANEPRYRMIVERVAGTPWETALIEAINDGQFKQPGAAMQVLAARVDRRDLRRRIETLAPRTDAAGAMQAFARRLEYVPTTASGMDTCAAAYRTQRAAIDDVASLATSWREQYGYKFEPWDFPLLAKLSRDPLRRNVSRAHLVIGLAQSFMRRRHTPRKVDLKVGPYDFSDQFSKHVESLSMADLWRLTLLNEMLDRPLVQMNLREMADRDRNDTGGAWGGLVSVDNGQAEAKLYPMAESTRRDDLSYTPSPQAVESRWQAVCIFHGHFEKIENANRAGPSADELLQARKEGYAGLVIASVGDGLFAAHYYNPEMICISLGKFPFR
jgi:hypothetical protein